MQPLGMRGGIDLTSVVDQRAQGLGWRHLTAHRQNGSTTQYTLRGRNYDYERTRERMCVRKKERERERERDLAYMYMYIDASCICSMCMPSTTLCDKAWLGHVTK